MARDFDIPGFYRSPIISTVKHARSVADSRKKDLRPSVLDLGPVRFKVARHFGFCFGVENAIEIAYRALFENPDKRVFLLSEMIHNPHVNGDLVERGVQFLLNTDGTQRIPFEELNPNDIVIVPAFGTTVELFAKLEQIGINPKLYNATCPFVEKVWRRAGELGEKGYTIVIHGKHYHEETRATFSHAKISSPSLVIRDLAEAKTLVQFICGTRELSEFFDVFEGRCSEGFDPSSHLERIGVVNQTTMLASETKKISELIKSAIHSLHSDPADFKHYFADTRDTLCYATYENQEATRVLMEESGDLALIVGGYNSSNTSHLVELLSQRMSAYFIKDAEEIISDFEIRHLDLHSKEVLVTKDWLHQKAESKGPLEILITAGASCPDALVEQVMRKIVSLLHLEEAFEDALRPFEQLVASVA